MTGSSVLVEAGLPRQALARRRAKPFSFCYRIPVRDPASSKRHMACCNHHIANWEVTMNHSVFKAFSGWASASKLIWRTIFAGTALAALFFLASCAKQGSGQHAIVYMRDGSQLTGMVTATSPSEITLAGDDKTTHTIPMAQVKSIEYDDAAAAPGSATSADNSGAGAAPSGRAPAARASSDRVHEHHYHPTQAQIHTKTYVVPSGTKVAVRTEDTIDSAKAAEGQTYAAEVADDVLDADGNVVIP